jgi:hypothetical protein
MSVICTLGMFVIFLYPGNVFLTVRTECLSVLGECTQGMFVISKWEMCVTYQYLLKEVCYHYPGIFYLYSGNIC